MRLVLQSKLFRLLAELCAAFDTERTGTVRLEELQQTAAQVLGEEKGRQLLAGVQADQDGRIRYTQLIFVLTRPPPQAAQDAAPSK
ncbi:hypothetical protein STCU_10930 [Strigomonas culicis]|uniref:EF-hand domain-containing protein n=1 Tax=Strigomonas culicis TaxID=28005 RepID=S9V227_9TRYP|nr:hypothetical protein STCU_10930 [Strigomonas culicis]|eukprot:EPY16880.1 hypothetical protein STCU_10930 [Strigomonas culicis]